MEENKIRPVKNIENLVRAILIEFPDTRDNDNLLILKVWGWQNKLLRKKETSFKSFAFDFIAKTYVSAESIRRYRQKIQVEHQDLRGKKWKERKKKSKDVTIEHR